MVERGAYLNKVLSEEVSEHKYVDHERVIGNVVGKLGYILIQAVQPHDMSVCVLGLQPCRDTEIDEVVADWHVIAR